MELTPRGTRGGGMPHLPGPLMKIARFFMLWFARLSGERSVILTTVGAKTGRQHAVSLARFPDRDETFLVLGSNMGSARHPAWYFNMVKNPDQVWAEVGKRKFKVRPELLKGDERAAAIRRVIAEAPGYGRYQQMTDREIPVVRLVPQP